MVKTLNLDGTGNSKTCIADSTTPRNMNLVASVVMEAVFIPAEVTPPM
jgi:hypothetical protein